MATGYVVPERPDWTRVRLAPAGDRFAAVRWHEGAANLWVGNGRSPLRLVSDLRHWRLRDYVWSTDGRGLILTLQIGDGERALAWLDLCTQSLARLNAGPATDALLAGQATGPRPDVLIGVRQGSTGGYRLQRVTPAGAVVAQWQAPARRAVQWLATGTRAVVVCPADDEGQGCGTGTITWWHTDLAGSSWSRLCDVPAVDATASRPIAFGADGATVFALSSAGRDTLALIGMSPPSWTCEVLSASPDFDVTSVLMAPDGSGPDLVTTTDPARPQHALSQAAAADLATLRGLANGAPATIVGRNASHCLAEIAYPAGGPAFVTFTRSGGEVSRPLLRFTRFARRQVQSRSALTFRARDGRLVTGFVTRPDSPPPWPVVLAIHDGPWARDLPQTDPWAQHLAGAGFCCVQVNYRGSRGFGKAFAAAGDGQWSLAMQDDLVDALESAELADVADLSRIAAIGYGYGGYAALMLATQTALPLAAVASAAAPTDLAGYVTGLLALGGAAGRAQATRIGDPVRDHDRLVSTSPVSRAADIRAPVLLFHGRQDAEVPVSHATSLADAIAVAGGRCELIVYEAEGHRLARPQNVADLRARTLSFLRATLPDPADAATARRD